MTETTTETTTRPGCRPRAAEGLVGLRQLGAGIERLRWVPSSLRARIVAWFIGVLALTTVLLVVVTYEVLLFRLDQRIDSELTQEAQELDGSPSGIDPDTGEPFASVKRIFDVYLQRNVPSRNEALITFLGGRAVPAAARPVVPYRLDTNPELRRALGESVSGPTDRGGAVDAGRAGRVPGRSGRADRRRLGGVFVDRRLPRPREDRGRLGGPRRGRHRLGVLLLGSLLAWRLADRVVQPVTALTHTARSISETDLSGRIPVEGQRRGRAARLDLQRHARPAGARLRRRSAASPTTPRTS